MILTARQCDLECPILIYPDLAICQQFIFRSLIVFHAYTQAVACAPYPFQCSRRIHRVNKKTATRLHPSNPHRRGLLIISFSFPTYCSPFRRVLSSRCLILSLSSHCFLFSQYCSSASSFRFCGFSEGSLTPYLSARISAPS